MHQHTVFKLLFITAILIVGIVYSILPHYVRYDTLQSRGEQYVPLTKESYFDVMNVHGGRYRDIIDGDIFGGEVDTFEHRDGPIFWPLLSAAMLAPFFLPFGTISPGIIISDFIFPIAIFFAFFFIIKSLVHNKFFALFSSFVLMLFPQMPLLIPPSSLEELRILTFQFLPFLNVGAGVDLTYLARESFIPGGPFFIFALFFIFQVVFRETKKKLFILLAGVSYGLLFYLYFYFWVFTTIVLGVLFLFLFFGDERKAAIRIVLSGILGFLVSIPFWVNQYMLGELPHHLELIERIGIEVGRDPKLFLWKTYALFLFLAALAIVFSRRGVVPRREGIFLAAIALSSIVALDINMVTNFVPQSDHWSGRVFLITNGILWSVFLYYFFCYIGRKWMHRIPHRHLWKRIGIVLVFSMLFLLTYSVALKEIVLNKELAYRYTVARPLLQAYEWLNQNTSKDSVVVSPSSFTNIDIPVYTHNRIYFARAITTLATQDEILERFYGTYSLFKMSLGETLAFAESPNGIFYLWGEQLRDKHPDSYLRPKPSDERYVLTVSLKEKIVNDYAHYVTPKNLPYRADYIFFGPRERAMGISERTLKGYDAVYDADDVAIYKL